MKLLVAGSHDFTDYAFFALKMDKVLSESKLSDCIIINDGTKGVAEMAAKYADEKRIDKRCYPIDWEQYGKKAGYTNNCLLADVSTHAIIFHDGENPYIKNLLSELVTREIPYRLFKVKV